MAKLPTQEEIYYLRGLLTIVGKEIDRTDISADYKIRMIYEELQIVKKIQRLEKSLQVSK